MPVFVCARFFFRWYFTSLSVSIGSHDVPYCLMFYCSDESIFLLKNLTAANTQTMWQHATCINPHDIRIHMRTRNGIDFSGWCMTVCRAHSVKRNKQRCEKNMLAPPAYAHMWTIHNAIISAMRMWLAAECDSIRVNFSGNRICVKRKRSKCVKPCVCITSTCTQSKS